MILGGLAGVTAAELSGPALDTYHIAEIRMVVNTYIGLAIALAVVAGAVWLHRNRLQGETHDQGSVLNSFDLLRQPRFGFGALCMFLYVGAEVAVGSLKCLTFGTAMAPRRSAATSLSHRTVRHHNKHTAERRALS